VEWTEHVRIYQGRTVKRIIESKPEGSRIRGRPRLRWMEDIEKDLREIKLRNGDRRQSKLRNGRM
jgi:hypothetical protein